MTAGRFTAKSASCGYAVALPLAALATVFITVGCAEFPELDAAIDPGAYSQPHMLLAPTHRLLQSPPASANVAMRNALRADAAALRERINATPVTPVKTAG